MNKKYTLLLGLVLLASCTSTPYDVDGLQSYIQEESNGIVKSQFRNGYELKLYNRPTDLWVAQELKNEMISDSLINQFRDRYDDYLYFILNISREGSDALYASEGFANFSDLLQTLSFRMGMHTEMVTSAGDTIPMADSHYSRLYGQSKSTSVMIAFNKEKIQETDWVQVNLSDLGIGTGRTSYRFNTKKLRSIPKLDFKTLTL